LPPVFAPFTLRFAPRGSEVMHRIADLQTKLGTTTVVGYDFASSLEEIVLSGEVDCYIVSTEYGFSPLGAASQFIASSLGIDESVIRELADWNRFQNEQVSLIGLPTKKPVSKLLGVVLAPSETSRCYERFATKFHGKPCRDFYYNVAYECIAYATKTFGAKKICMSHLSGSGHFHEDIATCTAEALGHFCDNDKNPPIDSFLFVGCCIEVSHLTGIRRLNVEGNATLHRDIRTWRSKSAGFDVVNLDWR
jgi:hypothetical protein